jgi:hypothetical protein
MLYCTLVMAVRPEKPIARTPFPPFREGLPFTCMAAFVIGATPQGGPNDYDFAFGVLKCPFLVETVLFCCCPTVPTSELSVPANMVV